MGNNQKRLQLLGNVKFYLKMKKNQKLNINLGINNTLNTMSEISEQVVSARDDD